MYSGFVGTVLAHFLSLISTLWAIFKVHDVKFQASELNYILLGLFLVAGNSCLALVRYGNTDGYKLRRLHIITSNISCVSYFAIAQGVFLYTNNSSSTYLLFPGLNIIPLVSNALAKDYRTKLKLTDSIIAINCVVFFISSLIYQNYYGLALSVSYFFGYFVIGECGYFLDTEVPSVDAFQYLTCFLNYFTVCALCY